jgi:hypothetical protein
MPRENLAAAEGQLAFYFEWEETQTDLIQVPAQYHRLELGHIG